VPRTEVGLAVLILLLRLRKDTIRLVNRLPRIINEHSQLPKLRKKHSVTLKVSFKVYH